jgi:hypothetical protein
MTPEKIEQLANDWVDYHKNLTAGNAMADALREIAATMRRGEVEMPEPHKPPVYATSENTPAVRDGYAVGGYEIEEGLYSYDQMVAYADAAVLAALGDVSLIDEGSKGKPAPKAEPVDERAAFEREMRCEEEYGHRSIARDFRGDYTNKWTNFAWAIWQARAAIAAAKENK